MSNFILKSGDGHFIKGSDGHPLEHFEILYTENLIEAKSFVSQSTAIRWAEAYQLEDAEVKNRNLEAAQEIKDTEIDEQDFMERYIEHFKRHLPDQCPIPIININEHKVLKGGDNRLYFWLGEYESRLRDFLPEDIRHWLSKKDREFDKVLNGDKDILDWDTTLVDKETEAFAETYNVEW